jgi:hypothetical protein
MTLDRSFAVTALPLAVLPITTASIKKKQVAVLQARVFFSMLAALDWAFLGR